MFIIIIIVSRNLPEKIDFSGDGSKVTFPQRHHQVQIKISTTFFLTVYTNKRFPDLSSEISPRKSIWTNKLLGENDVNPTNDNNNNNNNVCVTATGA